MGGHRRHEPGDSDARRDEHRNDPSVTTNVGEPEAQSALEEHDSDGQRDDREE